MALNADLNLHASGLKHAHLVHAQLQPVQRGLEVAPALRQRDGHRTQLPARARYRYGHRLVTRHRAPARGLNRRGPLSMGESC